jgi:deoxycytidine triphosphate deaminase
VVLSDVTIERLIAEGRIGIDPYDASLLQPSSVDVRVDRYFRVFHNARYPYIDVKQPQEALTELVEMHDDEEPFILHPGEFVLGSTLEVVSLPNDLVARLEGKALALDTEIPTLSGWKRMAEINPGDLVFTDNGDPTVVVGATQPMLRRPCYEVLLSDGTSIVCDAAHQWVTTDKNDRRAGRPPSVRTTEEIAGSVRAGDEWNHQIALSGSAKYPQRELPIDPYVLGAWVGDGTSTKAEITCADTEILDELAFAGVSSMPLRSSPLAYRMGGTGHTRDRTTGQYARNDSFSSKLRNLGLLGNKHIPAAYMTASTSQRFALLEGLMDTDGYVDAFGRCDLTTIKEELALQYHELVASLGFRPTLAEKRATLNGRHFGPKFEVQFSADLPVFRLSRKRARQNFAKRFHRFRAIVAVRSVPSVPVRCIEVAAPSGQFLVTRSYVPTHNSSLGRLGLLIHSTAGFIDPGFEGNVTLELSNVANLPITIYYGMKIGQISFMQMSEPAMNPYGSGALGSKYRGQRGPTPSRYYENFDK